MLVKEKKINDSWLRIEIIAILFKSKNESNDLFLRIIMVHKPYIAIWNKSFLIRVCPKIGDKVTIGDNKKVVEKYFLQFLSKTRKIRKEITEINWTKIIGFIFVINEKL